MLVLKICIGDWHNASHDKRELSVCEELGLTTAVLAKGNPNDEGRKEIVDGFSMYRYSTRPLGDKVPVQINRFVSIFRWASFVRKVIKPDIISGHDMYGLLIGWISNWFRGRKRSKLIYDSHEFELGLDINQNVAKKIVVKMLERKLISKSSEVLMVSDSIADEVMRIHHLKQRPTVVRNVPMKWSIDCEKIDLARQMLLSKCQVTNYKLVVMYHGGLFDSRGIEQLIDAVSKVPEAVLVILGNGEEEYKRKLNDLVTTKGINDRVVFHEAVSLDVLPNYVAAADVGVSILLPNSANHLFALPNKFFENIQCLNPLIVSDFPEMGKLMDEYQIGIKVNPLDSDTIANAIRRFITDEVFFNRCKDNLRLAKEELCWETEKTKLIEVYERIMA